uniref:TauD domain-containing protein n=1 Tax=Bursaphelenchus xylophilus TaxID=6326 RepID=A0A1I7RWV6_BURXY
MRKFLISLLAVADNAAPLQEDAKTAAVVQGIDTTAKLTDKDVACFLKNGFRAGIFRIGNEGAVDKVGVENARKSHAAGFKYELYIAPNPFSPAGPQFISAYNYARTEQLVPQRVWLQVTSPMFWDRNTTNNARFITDFIQAVKIRMKLDLALGPARAENRGPARGPEDVGPARFNFSSARAGPGRPEN